MKGIPGKPWRHNQESMKDWILANCPDEQGETTFLHEGEKVFYQYIDFPDRSPLFEMGDLIFYVYSDEAQEGDLLFLRGIKTDIKKIGFVMPVQIR